MATKYVPYMTTGGRMAVRRVGTGSKIRNHPAAVRMRQCLVAARGRGLTERKNALRNCK